MKLRIRQDLWYKEKTLFKALYKELGYRWNKDLNKWVSPGGSSYLFKLDMDGEFKRFIAQDCSALANFILSIGGKDEDVVIESTILVVDYNKSRFLGADIDAHYRWFHSSDADRIPDNVGAVWN